MKDEFWFRRLHQQLEYRVISADLPQDTNSIKRLGWPLNKKWPNPRTRIFWVDRPWLTKLKLRWVSIKIMWAKATSW